MAVDLIGVDPTPTRSHKVWLIGGTSESAELAQALWAKKIPYIVTVTTPAAKTLYALQSQERAPERAQVSVGALTPEAMATFVIKHNVRCILDASHPFATEISQQAITLSQASQSQASQPQASQPQASQSQASQSQASQSQTTSSQFKDVTQQPIPYLRYERASIKADIIADTTEKKSDSALFPTVGPATTVDSIDSLLKSDLLHHQRVLLTLGYRQLGRFASLRPKATLFARVLPSCEAIAGAMSAGFSSHEIIALRPPVSLALEKALWQQWQISRVVAKASGKPSGEAVKRQAAQQLGIQLILIQRPSVVYPQQTHSAKEAIAFCIQVLRMY